MRDPARAQDSGGRRQRIRRIIGRSRDLLRGHDLTLASAGSAFYGALAVVPSLLVAVAVANALFGADRMVRFARRLADALPTAQGADEAVVRLMAAGSSLSWVGVSFAVLMASAYGSGLRRALMRAAPPRERESSPAWRSRLMTLPLLGLAPLTLGGFLLVAPLLADLTRGSDPWGTALAVFVSLNVIWLLTWLPLTWAYRVVGPGTPRWGSALVGALVAGAFVSGFLQGFLVFLALPIDLGRPFGGLPGVGLVSGILIWLWVLHAVVAAGYALTWAVDEN